MKKSLFTAVLLTLLAFLGRAQVTLLYESFESGMLPAGWTVIDADNDGRNWEHNTINSFLGGHTGEGSYVSFSYDNSTGTTLFPNNWLITPPITLVGNSTLTFYRMVGFFAYAEHYGVFISTTSPTDPSSYTMLFEETPTSSSYAWTMKSVDLSAYTGQTVYIAFRHFNCSGNLQIGLDDITVTSAVSDPYISVLPTALQFPGVSAGSSSPAQTLTVEGYNVTGDIMASVNSPFEVSLDNINFNSSVSIPDTENVLYVRYSPTVGGSDTSVLTLSNGSATTNVSLFGTSIDCSNFSMPYMQNFNDVPKNTIPNCWLRINPFDGYPKTTDDYSDVQGDNVLMFKCNFNTYEPIYAVMPQMPVDLSSLQMTFSTFREGSYSGTLSVGYVTSPNDSSTFVPVWSINAAQIGDNNPHPYLVTFDSVNIDPSLNYYITFKYKTSFNWYWFVDNIVVEELATCNPPTDLAVTGVTDVTATVNWTGNVDNYHLYYKSATDTGWTVIEYISPDTAGYQITGLTPATAYTWYVAAACPDGTVTNSLATSTFSTECSDFIAPFVQNFALSSSLPQCWARYNGWANEVFAGGSLVTTNGGWGFDNSHVFDAYHAALNIYGTSCNRWLVTPPIDLSELTNPVLMFNLALTAYNTSSAIPDPTAQADDKFMVIVSTDHGATWSATNATVWSNDGNGNYSFNQISPSGEDITIPLTAYANQTVMIAFYGESTVSGNGDNDLHIDNVVVDNASNCAKPTNLSVASVMADAVTLSWTENGTATNWDIEYGPAGYQQGSAVATLVQANANPFTVDSLSAMAYDFYLRANCGGEHSFWTGPITVTPGSFSMGVTGSDTLTTCSLVVYDNGGVNGNYSSGCDYILVLYPETDGGSVGVMGTYQTEYSFDFLRIYDGAGVNNTMLGEYSGSGTVPALISSSGPLTLRFTSDNSQQSSGFQLTVFCENCPPPGNLTASNITSSSADLTWTSSYDAFMVNYKAAGDTAWNTEFVSDTTLVLDNLVPTTTYTVNVYGDCSGEYSPAATLTFTTTMLVTSLPYSTDFSGTQDWILNNGTCNSYWTIGSASGTNALYITTNGTSPAYNSNSYSAVSAEKLFTIGDISEVEISFDLKVGGETAFDYVKVFFAPVDQEYPAAHTIVPYVSETYSEYAVNFSDFMQYSTFSSYPYKYNLTNGNTVHVSVVMPNPNQNPTASSTAKLVFLWKNDSNGGEQPGAIVYNVSISELTCPQPINLTVNNITTNGADIQWTPSGSESSWILEYKDAGASTWNSMTLTTTTYSLSALTPGVSYQVRVQADCGNGDHSMWTNALFFVPCDAITVFPYTEDFENGGQIPDCWSQEYAYGSHNWIFKTGGDNLGSIHTAHAGSYNAFFYEESSEGNITRLVSPIFDLTGVANPYVTYWYAQQVWGNAQDNLSVYYRTSPTGQWQMLTQYSTSVNVWTKDSLALPSPSATYQIAFMGMANDGHGILLDDIMIAESSSGPAITNPTVATNAADPVAQTTATLKATITNPDNVSISAKGFEWKATTGGTYTQVAGTGTGNTFSAALSNLTPNTNYTYKAFITFNGQTVYGDEMTLTTLPEDTPEPCDIPTNLHASEFDAHSITIGWNTNGNATSWNIRYRVENGDWNNVTATTNTYVISGLAASTVYEIEVQANCGNGNVSEWSEPIHICTAPDGIDNWLENSVMLFPNPAREYIDIRVDGDLNVTMMEVYDVYGKLVNTVGVCDTPVQTRISVSGLADGVYFVRVTTDRGVVTKSFVKK